MKLHRGILLSTALGMLGIAAHPVYASDSPDPPDTPRVCEAFVSLAILLEVNATDNDGEVVVHVRSGNDGLRSLAIVGPGGRTLVAAAGRRNAIGYRDFILESTEPADLNEVLRAFPAGKYLAYGTTVGGHCLKGTMQLSHVAAPATTLLAPAAKAVVPVDGFVLRWMPVAGAVSYVITVDNEDRGTKLVAESAPNATSFVVPADWLEPGTSYTAAVAVKAATGNVSSVEIPVSTAAE